MDAALPHLQDIRFLIDPQAAPGFRECLRGVRHLNVQVRAHHHGREWPPIILGYEPSADVDRQLCETLYDEFTNPDFHVPVYADERGWGVFRRTLPGDDESEDDREERDSFAGDEQAYYERGYERRYPRRDRFRYALRDHHRDQLPPAGTDELHTFAGRIYRATGELLFIGDGGRGRAPAALRGLVRRGREPVMPL